MNGTVGVAAALALAALAAPQLQGQDLYQQAQAAYQARRTAEAYRLVERAAAAQPDRADVQELRGDIACDRATGRRGWEHPDLARECGRAYARAVALDSANVVYLESLLGFLSMAPRADGGSLDSALVVAGRERAVDVARGTWQMAGVLLKGGASWKVRADSLMHALWVAHQGERPVVSYVTQYYEVRLQNDSVLAAYQRLVNADPSDVVSQYFQGRQMVIMKRDPRAAQDHLLEAAMAPPPTPAQAGGVTYTPGAPWWRIGQTWELLGQSDSAQICFEEALRMQPGFPEAQASLDSLKRRLGRGGHRGR